MVANVEFQHILTAVRSATCKSETLTVDFEYYLQITNANSRLGMLAANGNTNNKIGIPIVLWEE